MSWFYGKKRMGTEFARSQTTGLSCVGHDAGTIKKYTPKPPNIAELKTALPWRIDME